MKKFLFFFIVLFLISEFTLAQNNTITYQFWIKHPVTGLKHSADILKGQIKEGEEWTLGEHTLPSSPVDFSGYQGLYNALEGAHFKFDENSLEEDITVDITLENISAVATGFNKVGDETLFTYFDIEVEDSEGNLYTGDNHYYFNEGTGMEFCVPKSAALIALVQLVGLDMTKLGFAIFTDGEWTQDGLTVSVTETTLCFKTEHLSKFGGGRSAIGSPATGLDDQSVLPDKFGLEQNYPNPFNPATTIDYAISEPGNVQLKVYNILGAEVATLVSGHKEAGVYKAEFDAREMPSGLYIYTLRSNGKSATRKMMLLK